MHDGPAARRPRRAVALHIRSGDLLGRTSRDQFGRTSLVAAARRAISLGEPAAISLAEPTAISLAEPRAISYAGPSHAMAAEDATGAAHESWANLNAPYLKYARAVDCDDGAIAEGWADAVARLLANRWDELPSLAGSRGPTPSSLPLSSGTSTRRLHPTISNEPARTPNSSALRAVTTNSAAPLPLQPQERSRTGLPLVRPRQSTKLRRGVASQRARPVPTGRTPSASTSMGGRTFNPRLRFDDSCYENDRHVEREPAPTRRFGRRWRRAAHRTSSNACSATTP